MKTEKRKGEKFGKFSTTVNRSIPPELWISAAPAESIWPFLAASLVYVLFHQPLNLSKNQIKFWKVSNCAVQFLISDHEIIIALLTVLSLGIVL